MGCQSCRNVEGMTVNLEEEKVENITKNKVQSKPELVRDLTRTKEKNPMEIKQTLTNSKTNITPETKYEDVAINANLIVSQSQGNPFENYTKDSVLGEGSFGTVYKVKHIQLKIDRAMKEIKRNPKNISKDTEIEIMNEINILKQMDHPNIVKIFEFFIQPNAFYLVTEFCSGGELFNRIVEKGPFSEEFTAFIMYQIFSSVFYCHSMGIIHRDLKPENILIDSIDKKNNFMRIKIIDFGTAKIYEKGSIEKKIIGSSYYIAPEVLNKNYTEKCDLWSCGVIMYILLAARAPFEGKTDQDIMARIMTGKYDMTIPQLSKISTEAKQLINSLLQKDPSKRINAELAMNHIWFKKFQTRDKLNLITSDKMKYINNMKIHRKSNVLQSAALAYLVHNFTQLNSVQELYKLFNWVDYNGDGKITKEELVKGFREFWGIESDNLEDEVDKIFLNIDDDLNGHIECEEFVRAGIDKNIFLTDDILRFAFRYFDRDGSGEITPDEIKSVFFQNNIQSDSNIDRKLKKIFGEVDVNNDGKISFEEFSHVMKSILRDD
jgi:calcium-dependent protein kinase